MALIEATSIETELRRRSLPGATTVNSLRPLEASTSGVSRAAVARSFPGTKVVAAGFCYGDEWVGGESETLKIASRGEKDLQLIRRLLHGTERETWDLVPKIEAAQQEIEPITIPFP